MPDDELLNRLRRFNEDAFPQYREQFKSLVEDGQRPTTLFIGCSDSRLVPYLLTGAGPGELFVVRNVGAFVPPYDGSHGLHGTAAAIEFAVLSLNVSRIVVCGHSHCGAIKTLYGDVPAEAQNLSRWLELGREATLPVVPGAKACVARLAGQEPPKFEDNESTVDELRQRIRKTLEYVQSVPVADIDGSEDRDITIPLRNRDPLHFKGDFYLRHWALPNFLFHCSMTYALLRHNGVDLGKSDFLAVP